MRIPAAVAGKSGAPSTSSMPATTIVSPSRVSRAEVLSSSSIPLFASPVVASALPSQMSWLPRTAKTPSGAESLRRLRVELLGPVDPAAHVVPAQEDEVRFEGESAVDHFGDTGPRGRAPGVDVGEVDDARAVERRWQVRAADLALHHPQGARLHKRPGHDGRRCHEGDEQRDRHRHGPLCRARSGGLLGQDGLLRGRSVTVRMRVAHVGVSQTRTVGVL